MRRISKHRLWTELLVTLSLVVLAIALLSVRAAAAAPANGSGYRLDWWTADGGGATSLQGGGYMLRSTAGQPDGGTLLGDGYTLASGFWGRMEALVYRIFVPLVMRDYWGPYQEQEPNDTSGEANGPVVSDEIYYGTMPVGDPNDYFYLDLTSTGSAELWLTEIPSGCNYDLVLRDASLDIKGYSGNLNSADEHVVAGSLPAGRYYIQVYHRSAAGSTEPYNLRVVYP